MKVAVDVYPLHSGHKTRGIGYYTKNLLEYLEKENIELIKFLNRSEAKEADLIHYPWFDLYFHTLPVFKPLPTVVTIHDVIPLIFKKKYPVGIKGRINLHLQKIALRNCKFVITDSLNSKKDLVKYLQVQENKIAVVPLAADPQFRLLKDTETLRIKRKYSLPDKFLMYVGDANWIKNLPFLIEAFNKLVRLPDFEEVKLVLVGGVFLKNVEDINHPELESLKMLNRKIKEYNLESQIIRPGNISQEELVSLYNLATVYVQPSLYEGFGLPILEAMMCGTPVISSNAGSLPEVGDKAALYFDPTDLTKFIALLTEVLQDKSLRNKLSKLGFEQADKFSWKETAKQTMEVYKRAIQGY